MISLNKNKRGTLSDLAIILGFFLALAITVVLANMVWQQYQLELADAIDLSQYPYVESSISKTTDLSMPMLDKIFLAFVVASFIGTMLLGFRVRNSPIFIMFVFIFMPILVLLAKIMKDVYNEFASNTAITDRLGNATITFTAQIMGNLPKITIGFAIALSVVLYVIRQREAL